MSISHASVTEKNYKIKKRQITLYVKTIKWLLAVTM